jgi:hypothetical protein
MRSQCPAGCQAAVTKDTVVNPGISAGRVRRSAPRGRPAPRLRERGSGASRNLRGRCRHGRNVRSARDPSPWWAQPTALFSTPVAPDRVGCAAARGPGRADRAALPGVRDRRSRRRRARRARPINIAMHACCFALSKVLPIDYAVNHIRDSFAAAFGKRGREVVVRNLAALGPRSRPGRDRRVRDPRPANAQRVTLLSLDGRGDELPVSRPRASSPSARRSRSGSSSTSPRSTGCAGGTPRRHGT